VEVKNLIVPPLAELQLVPVTIVGATTPLETHVPGEMAIAPPLV
jgi:hypothetical protein